MLERVAEPDAEGFFRVIQTEWDRWRICGLSSIYALLGTLDAKQGQLLKYSQWPDPVGTVTFASAIFQQKEAVSDRPSAFSLTEERRMAER